MYQEEEDYMEEGDESEEISNEIWQEACWTVISAYFEEKGEEFYYQLKRTEEPHDNVDRSRQTTVGLLR